MGKPGPQPFNTNKSGQTVSSLPGQQRRGPESRVLVFFYEFAVTLLINRVYHVKFSTFPWLIKYFLNELPAHPVSVVMTFELSSSSLLGFSKFYADREYRKRTFFVVFEERHSHSPDTFPQSWWSKLSAETFAHISLYTSRSMKWVPSTGKEHCTDTTVPCSLACSHPVPRPLVSFPRQKRVVGIHTQHRPGPESKAYTLPVQFFLFWFIYIIWCVNVLAICIYVNHMSAWCPKRPKEDIRYPKTG